MAESDRRKWDAKHAAILEAGSPDAPTTLLDVIATLLPEEGRALDVACGRGASAVWLAQRGLDVTGVDVSRVALDELRRRADAAGVGDRVLTIEHDLDAGLPADLGEFDLVLCSHFHAPEIWPAFRAALAPGGVLALETPTSLNADLGLRAPNARYLVAPGEIVTAAAGLEMLLHVEAVLDGVHRARLVARRPATAA